jgi:phosphate butyryltransferase
MELKSLNTFIYIAKKKPRKKIVVAAAEDEQVLSAVSEAYSLGIADAILVGNLEKINESASNLKIDLSNFQIINETVPTEAGKTAVRLIREDKAHLLVKGFIGTADFLRPVLNKDTGLRKGELLSHIGFFELPAYHKLLALTDAAQNISPTFEEKISILKNSVDLFHRLGVKQPKIAVLAAVETVSLKMETTVQAAMLSMMNRRGQLKGCFIDGPLAFDLAISKEAAHHKGIQSDVAGDSDLLLAANIEMANVLYKSFTYFGNATVAAVIIGAMVPIVLTSRADSDRSKLMSIALAASY